MKFMHLADLHLGKCVNGFSMLEDQRAVLGQILAMVRKEKPDALLIAGDVYDKGVPSVEAALLLNDFLIGLERTETVMIAGNHDSSERLSFGRSFFRLGGVHISPPYDGHVQPVVLNDAYGEVHVWMLPYVRASEVRACFPDERVENIADAVACAIRHFGMDSGVRNVLAAHLFVSGAARSDSETGVSVGTLENVPAGLFAPFEYTALGHLHIPQDIGSSRVRYCGSPLKYSFSEVSVPKSVTVVELEEKGAPVKVRALPLAPLHDMRELRGSFDELMDRRNYQGTAVDDYLHITLTDEQEKFDAVNKLRTVYPNLMVLDYDYLRARSGPVGELPAGEVFAADPMALAGQFYRERKGGDAVLSTEQKDYLQAVIHEFWEGR